VVRDGADAVRDWAGSVDGDLFGANRDRHHDDPAKFFNIEFHATTAAAGSAADWGNWDDRGVQSKHAIRFEQLLRDRRGLQHGGFAVLRQWGMHLRNGIDPVSHVGIRRHPIMCLFGVVNFELRQLWQRVHGGQHLLQRSVHRRAVSGTNWFVRWMQRHVLRNRRCLL
jgi:hypothetical protein